MAETVGWGKTVPKTGFGPGDLSTEAANSGTMDPDDRPSSDDETVEGTDRSREPGDGTDRSREPGDGTERRKGEADDRNVPGDDRTDVSNDAFEDGSEADDQPTQKEGESAEEGEFAEEGESAEEVETAEMDEHEENKSLESATGADDVHRNSADETETNGWEGNRGPEERGLLWRFRHDLDGPLMWIREMLASALIVLFIALLLFAASGVWPPMVAVESGSMEPNLDVGDLVFVTEPGRFAPDAANNDVGVVTYETGQEADYRSFGAYGSVVIFQPPGRTASPIIHRAMFHVEEGEDWYDRADDRFHRAESCEELRHCPAPHDGFITLGDNNAQYDQANGLAEPVRAEWVTGVARVRVPYLGYVRLIATGQVEIGDLLSSGVVVEPSQSAVELTAEPAIERPTKQTVERSVERPSLTGTSIRGEPRHLVSITRAT